MSGRDFVLEPPPSLFGTTGPVPRMALSRVRVHDDCENALLVRVEHLSTGIVECLYRHDDSFGFAGCAGDLVQMYVRHIRTRQAEIMRSRSFVFEPVSLSSAAYFTSRSSFQNITDWSDDIRTD